MPIKTAMELRSGSKSGRNTLGKTSTKSHIRRQSQGSAANQLSRTEVWLATDPVLVPGEAVEYVNLHISEELYLAILEVARSWSKVSQRRNTKSIVARLYIWGRDFSNGKLSIILTHADDLREMILRLLQEIGHLLCQGKQNSIAALKAGS